MISNFFAENMLLMRVIYMLLFFLYAFAIALKINKRSELKLAKSLWLLALYGLLFGITEFITIFLFVREGSFSASFVQLLGNIELFIKAIAYQMIFWLGLRLVADFNPQRERLPVLGVVLSGLWLVTTLAFWSFDNQQAYLLLTDNLSRYLFSAPGLALTGYGLILHSREVEKFKIPTLVKQIKGLAYTFFTGVFFIGMVPTHPILWTAAILNSHSFLNFTGMPIVFFRSLYLVAITYFVVTIVSVFEVEREFRLENALKRQVLAEERDRIARELHDGIIQSIYGVGLRLKQYSMLQKQEPNDSDSLMNEIKSDLNNIIQDVRDYIEELHLNDYSSVSFKEALQQLIAEYRKNAVMEIEYNIAGKQMRDLNIVQVNNTLQILRELLSNATKHSRASTMSVHVLFTDDELVIDVSDNGVGFNPQQIKKKLDAGEGKGLDNIFHRVMMLQGKVVFNSVPGKGTHFKVNLPYSKVSYLQNMNINTGNPNNTDQVGEV